jgi:hypothetical protein
MASGPGDLALAVGDGARRMTYAELAAISTKTPAERDHPRRGPQIWGTVRRCSSLAQLARHHCGIIGELLRRGRRRRGPRRCGRSDLNYNAPAKIATAKPTKASGIA